MHCRLKSLELTLPVHSNLGFVRLTQEHLEEYIGLTVVPLNLLKREIDNIQISNTVDHCEPSRPVREPLITGKDVRELSLEEGVFMIEEV